MKRSALFVLVLAALLFLLPLQVSAIELPDWFEELYELLTESGQDVLGGDAPTDCEGAAAYILEFLEGRRILTLISQMVKDELFSSVRLFASLCGLLIISSVVSVDAKSLSPFTFM